MAILRITEYRNLATDGNYNTAQAGKEPALAFQQVDFTSGEAKSAAFHPETRAIRIRSDTDCDIAFGSDPTAVSGASTPIGANETEFFGVGGNDKVSAV
jgi:hypothetical protein